MTYKSPFYVRLFFVFIAVCAIAILILGGSLIYRIYKESHVPQSALGYALAERTFIETFVLDKKNGGYNYWVEKDGSVKDSKKYSIFQANIILWLGGLESQKPDQKNKELITKAADYLVKHLYKGKGEWLEFDTSNHRTKQDFFWNPRNETYIAYALLQAYRITQNRQYLRVAQETTQAQRDIYPDGEIRADYGDMQDIGYRFPEHLGHLQEYRETKNKAALEYATLFDEKYRGRLGKELLSADGKTYYYHGMATLAQLIYGYLTQNPKAYEDGSRGRETYWSAQHNDGHHFDTSKPGESSDNGRDYHDKRLAMDLVEWTQQNNEDFRDDALETWEQVKSFWDPEKPYGFLINTEEGRKTCFTIGMPMMLMDLTPPVIQTVLDTKTGFWNHQLRVTTRDPEYIWNDIQLRGIGQEPKAFDIQVPWGFSYGQVQTKTGACEGCVDYTVNFIAPFTSGIRIRLTDQFGNNTWLPVSVSSSSFMGNWDGNTNTNWFYLIILSFLGVTFLTCAIVFYLLSLKKIEPEKPKRLRK